MKKLITIISALLLTVSMLQSQTMADVLRYSFTNPTGSARYLGTGGSMGAFGADYSAISTNPAAIGSFWTSEFVISPSILSSRTDSKLGDNMTEGRNVAGLKLDNFGMLMHRNTGESGLRTFNTAIGMNKIADFNDEFYYSGYTLGTITERFAQRANGKSVDELDLFEADLAYATGAIYAPDENNTYITDFFPEDFVQKGQDIDQTGGINEFLFGFGGNLNNRLLLGVTVGVPYLNYESTKVYNETDDADEIPAFNQLEYQEYLSTSGIGFNLKTGLIFKISKNLQIGGAFHSPTRYTLTDNYFSSLTYSFSENEGSQTITESSPDGNFRYRINTPWKAIGSIGFKQKIGKVAGFINGDLEWIDYRNGLLNLERYSSAQTDVILQEDINEQIESQLLSVINLKVGGEIAVNKFRARAGYNMFGSPYAADKNLFFPAYSLGLGWREDTYYLDLGWRTSQIKEGYIPYVVLDDDRLQVVENNRNNTKLVFTIGFQF